MRMQAGTRRTVARTCPAARLSGTGHGRGRPCAPVRQAVRRDRGRQGTGTPQAARRDRDGREPVRQTETPRRAVAALFPAIVRRTCPARSRQTIRTADRPARTVAADRERLPQTVRTCPARSQRHRRRDYPADRPAQARQAGRKPERGHGMRGERLPRLPNLSPSGGRSPRHRVQARQIGRGAPVRQTVRHRHGERLPRLPIVRRTCHRPAARLSAHLSGEIAADYPNRRPSGGRSRRDCPARARTRPARADARAGGCGVFPAIVPAHLSGRPSGGEPVRTLAAPLCAYAHLCAHKRTKGKGKGNTKQ